MRRLVMASVVLALCVVSSRNARADDPPPIVAVLPLNVALAQLDEASHVTLEEDIRSVAGNHLTPLGYTVLTGENTLRVLSDNGVDPTKACDSSCALDAARELKAEYFISGTVAKSEGTYVAFIRLFEQKKGQQLASVKLEGEKVRDLRQQFEQNADNLFAAVPRLTPVPPAQPQPAAPPPVATTTPAPAQAAPVQPAPAQPAPVVEAPVTTEPMAMPQPEVAPRPEQSPRRVERLPAQPMATPAMARLGAFLVTAEAVTDNRTGLMWQRLSSLRAYGYVEAMEYCRHLRVNGLEGWRVPALGEYNRLIKGQIEVESGATRGFFGRERVWARTRVHPQFETAFPGIDRDVVWALRQGSPVPTVGSDAVVLEQRNKEYEFCTNAGRCHVRCVR